MRSLFDSLSEDLQLKIIKLKIQLEEQDEMIEYITNRIIQKWHKYCSCHRCVMKRLRLIEEIDIG